MKDHADLHRGHMLAEKPCLVVDSTWLIVNGCASLAMTLQQQASWLVGKL